jgi:lipopolysaccharide heptosyltransferase I
VNDSAQRFLIVRLGSLGDVIHAIPAVAALLKQHPDARVDWIVDPRYVDLVKKVERIGNVIPCDTGQGWGSLIGLARRLRRERYDAVVDLQGLLKSAVLARIAGGRRTLGFTRAHLREPVASLFYTETHDPGGAVHVIDKGLALMRALGVQDTTVRFPLGLPSQAASDRYVLINPGAAWPNKRWPPERFGALAAALRERHGLRSVVLWGPGEEAAASAVVAASRGAAEQAPATSITDIVSIATGASLMVSGDTGPLHIAAAVGTPIVALFGPTRAERNGPWSASDISITRYDQCVCHYERRCRRAQPCIDDISVEEVIAAVERRVAAR